MLSAADAVGLDCEWKPSTLSGSGSQPAQFLQVRRNPNSGIILTWVPTSREFLPI